MNNMGETDTFLEKLHLPLRARQSQELKPKPQFKQSLKNRKCRPAGFTGELHQTLRKELRPIFLKLFQKTSGEETLPISFYVVTITLILKPDKDFIKKENYRPVITAENRYRNPYQTIQQH